MVVGHKKNGSASRAVSSMTINSRAERHCKLNAIIILQCSGNGGPWRCTTGIYP